MTQATLEARMDALEKQLADLQAQVQKLTRPKDWRNIAGRFEGNEGMKQIFEEARKIREKDRRRTKPKATKSRPRKHP